MFYPIQDDIQFNESSTSPGDPPPTSGMMSGHSASFMLLSGIRVDMTILYIVYTYIYIMNNNNYNNENNSNNKHENSKE